MILDAIKTVRTALRPLNATPENPSFDLNSQEAWDLFGAGATSDAGVQVTHSGSLELAPVWQAVSTISGDIACMTVNKFRRDGDDREIASSDPVNRLVATKPNDITPAFELWRRLMVHVLIWGNGYVRIVRPGKVGRPIELLNLLPDRTAPIFLEDESLVYVTEVDGEVITFLPGEIIHIKGISGALSIGIDPTEKARNSWGTALAAEGFSAKFFANGATIGGIL